MSAQRSSLKANHPPPAPPRIRKRPVSFGNPALGTYQGFVYTLQQETNGADSINNAAQQHCRPLVEGAVEVRRLVAMVDVPPEQVPEGILNLARSHRPWIDHVRIVIAEPPTTSSSSILIKKESSTVLTLATNNDDEKDDDVEATKSAPTSGGLRLSTLNPSPNASAMETAASILAKEQENEMEDQKYELEDSEETNHEEVEENERTYLVLIELCSEEAAAVLVQDLHRQPYTSLDETVTCSVYHVVALQGVAGVSLMSPFFAASQQAVVSSASGQLNAAISAADSHISTASSSSSAVAIETKASTTVNRSSIGSSSSNIVPSPSAEAAGFSHHHHGNSNKLLSSSHGAHHHAEDYNCAVCLEHINLDRAPIIHGSGSEGDEEQQQQRTCILTTVCNHSFHMDCLLQWQDSPCPVCRYDHSGLNETLSQCHVCGTTENNYVCLICGVVSCGDGVGGGGGGGTIRVSQSATIMASTSASVATSTSSRQHPPPTTSLRSNNNLDECRAEDTTTMESLAVSQHRMSSSHARAHYDQTLHAYALNTETQHVWDFAGQGYVHRLLQNKEDGKLVEVNDPRNTTSQERSLSPGLTGAQEDEVVHRKLEGFASQYYTLLKSQLEQQRIFYEGRLEEIRREYSDSRKQRPSTVDLIAALKQERHQLSQRLTSVQKKCRKVEEDVAFLKSMNESVEANRGALKHEVERAQRDRVEARKLLEDCLPPLQEKVTRLMLQLESSNDSGVSEQKPPAR